MNNIFSHNRCAAAPVWSRVGSPRSLLAIATACLLVPLSVGCQVGYQEQAILHHPAFEQLEQGCFGYEPTVWRTMGEDCEQAVRMIPNEVIHVPAAAPVEATPPAQATEPSPEDGALAEPGQAELENVPDPNPLNSIPRIVQPEAMPDTPAVPEAPALPQTPPVPQDATPRDAPAEPAGADPIDLPTAEPPVSQVRPKSQPAIMGPQIQPASSAATQLFRTLDEALSDTTRSTRVAAQPRSKPAAAGLSRFISY